MNSNTCGECRACCIVLPIIDPALEKPAGEPCRHLCESGCSLYAKTDWPETCRAYFCDWRDVKWMDRRPLYRPDKLGVIFESYPTKLVLYEVIPGALESPAVQYIKNRLRGCRSVKSYPAGVRDGYLPDAQSLDRNTGTARPDPNRYVWEFIGENEVVMKKREGCIALPLVH